MDEAVTEAFHLAYYNNAETTWKNTYWMGVPTQKCPLDLWVYQEILHEIRPDVLIETGTLRGGSALFFASMFDLLGKGRVITIDVHEQERPQHNRIRYVTGSSTSEQIVSAVRQLISADEKIMVVLDSDHTAAHVLGEMQAYGPLVVPGSYMIVEDTNVNGRPVLPDFGPGPAEAVEEFLRVEQGFVQDRTREKFGMTFCVGGYLKRIR